MKRQLQNFQIASNLLALLNKITSVTGQVYSLPLNRQNGGLSMNTQRGGPPLDPAGGWSGKPCSQRYHSR